MHPAAQPTTWQAARDSPRGPTGSGSSAGAPPPPTPAVLADRRVCVLCLTLAYSNPGNLCDACAGA
eukprot:9602329-Alexandrium_andersonii.AAC.1